MHAAMNKEDIIRVALRFIMELETFSLEGFFSNIHIPVIK
jgi:hypothetical protein